MADELDRLPLPRALPELRRLAGAAAPGYRRLYSLVLDGRIPAEIGRNGRWTVSRADLPRIAAMLPPAARGA
jgi:hypothetical protein